MGGGTIEISVLGSGIVETRASGIVGPAQVNTWMTQISALRYAGCDSGYWLIDALDVDVIVPGSTGAVVNFARHRESRVHAVALVTRLPVFIGLSQVFSVLFPGVKRRVFPARSKALEFLNASAPRGVSAVPERRGV